MSLEATMGVVAMVHSVEHFQISQSKLGFMHLGSSKGIKAPF
jgi:hypothetical protein